MATPVFTQVSPTAGSKIGKDEAVILTVTDTDDNITLAYLVASLDINEPAEVVHDNVSFRPKYNTITTSRSVIANGFQYSVLREGGWPATPTFSMFARSGTAD